MSPPDRGYGHDKGPGLVGELAAEAEDAVLELLALLASLGSADRLAVEPIHPNS